MFFFFFQLYCLLSGIVRSTTRGQLGNLQGTIGKAIQCMVIKKKKQFHFLRNNYLALFLSWSVKDLEFSLSSGNLSLSGC